MTGRRNAGAKVPEERGYERRVRTGAAAALPSVSAESFGAGLAREVERTGHVLHAEAIEDSRIDTRLRQNAEWTSFQASFAATREDISELAREGRKTDDPGHAQRIAEQWRAREEELLAGLSSEQLRQRARGSLAEWGAGFRAREADWEDLRQGEITVERYREQRGVAEGRIRRLESPADYAAELKIQMDAIGGLDASDKVKSALVDETEQVLAISFLRGTIDRDPMAARALLDAGSFDGVLNGDQVEGLLNASAVEIRRAQAAAEHAANVETAALKQDISLFKELEGQGRANWEDLPGMLERARAAGLEREVAQLEGLAANEGFERQYQGLPPTALEQRLAGLNRKGSLSQVEQLEREWIEGHLPGIEGRYRSDPVGFHAREGGTNAPPPLDFEDPASIAERSRWARANGTGTPFSENEEAELRRQYEGGRAGEEGVLALLNRLPADQAMAAARAIDPQDRTLPIAVTLDANHRAIVRRGREALRANKTLLSEPLKDDLGLAQEIATLNGGFDQALSSVAPEQRAAIRETAKQLLAGAIDKNGGGYSARAYAKALSTALGARYRGGRQIGGLARWNEDWFLLPDGVSAQQFGQAARTLAANGKVKPVNPDGSPLNINRGVHPVAVENGWYEFRTRGGRIVRGDNGKPWRIRMRD